MERDLAEMGVAGVRICYFNTLVVNILTAPLIRLISVLILALIFTLLQERNKREDIRKNI